jgi:pyruvate dehydrogenase E1 component alpha subunit
MYRIPKINKKFLLNAFEKILTIRIIEEKIAQKSKENKIWSFLHLSIGQEASATGVALGTKKNDLFLGNHRSHAHYLAKDGNLEKMIMEIFGDERGCCNGYGGSMHMLDKKVNFMGSIPILGSSISVASGMAMAEKIKKSKNVVVVFVGDGAAEEGSFYETINMAGLYKLPLLVIIEDNKYAVESSHNKRKVKNYNFMKVFKTTELLRKNILKKKRVGILHCDCIRFSKHSGANVSLQDQKSPYRDKKEYLEIDKRDPINILSRYLLIKKYLKLNELQNIKSKKVLQISNRFESIFKKIPIRTI